ncbi:WD40 repeat domain-containing protein [Paractinoplanes atraurantiacus]|uniref:WD40 repeat n=1 Tax=Paractinoplanes atraurantiacus TaxID=1036182 RepID=A0A285KA41_9ACTN|nr:WD40 repeat domain-containing protein [Actinoplanes atraurantiacus]SNY69494.1 WD40 repeat [Actinoplanes atraurantiacus]
MRGVRIAHRAPVHAVAGGRSVVLSAGGDGTIRSWDVDTGAAGDFRVAVNGRAAFLGLAGAVGSGLVIWADGTAIRRFDLASGDEIGERLRAPGSEWLPIGGLGPVAMLAEEGSALLVAGSAAGTVCRWDAMTGEAVGRRWTANAGQLLAIAVSRLRDGRVLVATSGNGGALRLWDATTGEPVGPPLAGHGRPVTALGWTTAPDGRDLLIGQEFEGPLHFWDANSGEVLRSLPHRSSGLNQGGLAMAPDGPILFSVDQSGTPWRWDLSHPDPVATMLPGPVTAIAVVPSEQGPLCVTGEERGRLRRWDESGGPAGEDFDGHPSAVDQLTAAVGEPAVLVSAGRDGIRCWNAVAGNPPLVARAGNGLAAAWSPSGRLVVATGVEDGILRVDALNEADPEVDPVGETVWDVAAGAWPDGRVFFAGGAADGHVHLVDAETGEALRPPLPASKSPILAVAVATLSDGRVLLAAGGEDRTVVRYDAATGERIGSPLPVAASFVTRLVVRSLSGGRTLLVAVDDAGEVFRWNALTGEALLSERTTGSLSGAVPERVVAVAHEDTVRCWDALTGSHLADVEQARSAVVVEVPGGRSALAVGHMDGSLTITPFGAAD